MAELNIYTSPVPTVAPGQDSRHAPWGRRARPPFPAGDGAGTARGPAGPAFTTPPLAAEVLLGAQESRIPERVRAFDIRAAYGDRGSNGRAHGAAAFTPEPEIPDADIVPPDTASATARTMSSPAPEDNVIHMFATPATDGADGAPGPRHAAHQAYVNAGGMDGRGFATGDAADTARPVNGAGLDISI